MRTFCIENPGKALLVFFLLVMVLSSANYWVERGGVLDNAIARKSHPAYQEDKHVAGLFPSTEIKTFVYRDPIDFLDDLREIKRMTEEIRKYGWGKQLWSLTYIPNVVAEGDNIYSNPIINDAIFEQPNKFNIEAFKEQIRNNESLRKLVGKDFQYAKIVVEIPRGYNEPSIFWDTMSILEERGISWWEPYWNYDIHPTAKNSKWSSTGWVDGREVIRVTVFRDSFRLTGLSVVIIAIILWLTLKSVTQVAISLGLITISLVLARGSIPILNLLGYAKIFGAPLDEKAYILLIYTYALAQGCSYCIRKCFTFNKIRRENPLLNVKEIWEKTKKVDGKMILIGIFSAGGLFTLYSFPLSAIQEMGIIGGVAVGFLTTFSLTILPAGHIWLVRKWPKLLGTQRQFARHTFFDSIVEAISKACANMVLNHSVKVVVAASAAVCLAVFFITQGKMIVGTNALKFTQGTMFYKTAEFLNQYEGADVLVMSVEPAIYNKDGGKNLYNDFSFLNNVAEFRTKIEGLPNSGDTISIVDSISQISRVIYDKKYLASGQELAEGFSYIESSSLDPALLRSLYYEKSGVGYGLQILAQTKAMGDSILFRQFGRQVKEIARKDFPNLKINFGGKNYLWGVQDELIGYGKPINVAISTLWVMIASMVWLFYTRKQGKLSPWYGGAIMPAPLTFAAAMIALIMMAFRYPLNQANCVIMALAIGIAIDFSIYLIGGYKQRLAEGMDQRKAIELTIKEEGREIIPDAIANSLGVFPLWFSPFEPVSEIGVFAPAMILLCAIGSLVVLMALVYLKKAKA